MPALTDGRWVVVSKNLQKNMERYKNEAVSRRKKRFRIAVGGLAVAMATAYALMLPAISLTTICGLEAHRHGPTCFATVAIPGSREIVCGVEKSGAIVIHQHDPYCYDADGNLICPLPERVEHTHTPDCFVEVTTFTCAAELLAGAYSHTHDERCYDEKGTLICPLQEIPAHTHTEGCYESRLCFDCAEALKETAYAHTHGELCYDQNGVLVCPLEERAAHVHDESCWIETEILTCPLEEGDEHVHTKDCYTVVRSCSCGLEESVEHVHNESCLVEERVRTCGQEETTPHVHSEACLVTSSVAVCGFEELHVHVHTDECAENGCTLPEVVVHQHTGDCVRCGETEERQVLICELPEHDHTSDCYPDRGTCCGLKAHIHDESCRDEEGTLICGKEEHEHTDECRAPETEEPETVPGENESFLADPYARVDWTEYDPAALSAIVLSGDWAGDVVEIAKSQVGYRESTTDFVLTDEGRKTGYTPYGERYGCPYDDWCASFASFCLDTAGVQDFPRSAGCRSWIELLQSDSCKRWRSAENDETGERYTPRPGDLIFYDFDLDGQSDHVGLVYRLADKTENEPALIQTIEGNYCDRVCLVTHAQDYAGILGYGELPENPALSAATPDKPEENLRLVAETESGVTVTVTGAAGAFPENGETLTLTAREMDPDGAEEADAFAFEQMAKALDEEGERAQADCVRLFELRLIRDGKTVQPQGTVSVAFGGLDEALYAVYGVEESAVERLDASQTEDAEIVCATDSLAVFGIMTEEAPHARRALTSQNRDLPTASLTVTKVWNGPSTASVTVALYDAQGATGDTVTLSASNNWTASFTGLAVPAEGQSLGYYVREIEPDDYLVSYGPITEIQSVSGTYWVPVASNQLSDGGSYVFCTHYNSMDYTPSANPGTNYYMTSAREVTKNGPITINGVNYSDYLTGVDATAVFYAMRSGNGFLLYNDATGKYMNSAAQCVNLPQNPTNNQRLLLSSTGYLGACDGTRYIYQVGTRGVPYGDYGGTTAQNNASIFQAYEQVTAVATPNRYETTITNIYIDTNPGNDPSRPEIHKTIDYLGDGVSNPDTTLAGGDYYRLYLDLSSANTLSTSGLSPASISGVSITDALSPYVQLYGAQADYKVTMTAIATGQETALYQNGAVTQAGSGIVSSVSYTAGSGADSTGTVRLNFVSGYVLNNQYRYTLSFNVALTQDAYDAYQNLNQQYPHLGDNNTDYIRPGDQTANETSSAQPGLRANKVAYVDYTLDGSGYIAFYPYPVVQAARTVSLTVQTQVIGGSQTSAFSYEAVFADSSGQTITSIPAGSGYTVQASTGVVSFTLTPGQSVTISGIPADASASVTETSHDGYAVTIKEGAQTLAATDFGTILLPSDRSIVFVNSAGAVLPETGGPGPRPFTLSGMALLLAAGLLLYRKKRENE